MIYIAGISIALFISALLLNKKNKSKSDILLFIWMLLIAAHLFLYYINFSKTTEIFHYLVGLEIPLPLLHGVFLYYYVSSVTNQFPRNKWVALLHLVPAIAGYIYLIPFFLLPAEEKLNFFAKSNHGYQGFMSLGLILIFLSGIFYVVWSSILLRKHKKNIQDQFSDIEDINLRWLQFLTTGLGVIWSVVIITNNDHYIFLGVSIFVILIGFFGVQQSSIFNNVDLASTKPNNGSGQTETKKEKYATSGLSNELAEDVYKKLIHLVKEKKYYCENNISLNDLAAALTIHPNYLSQIINEMEEKNFYDFINGFRVEEFKRLVKAAENKQFTLIALAYDSGFNSKSSFNRYFKKHTGQTPSQYVKWLQKQA